MNELKRHKKSDKIKWAFTAIAFVLIAVMLVGLCMQVFAKDDKFKPSTWFTKNECEHIDDDEDGVCDDCGEDMSEDPDSEASGGLTIPAVSEGNGISLLATKIPVELYDDYGIATIAETAYTLTATITPSNADDKTVDWSVAWKNSSSSWANGKTVTSYVKVTPTSDGALTATVSCLVAFGEQVIVTVVPRANKDVSATCTVDYRQRVTGVATELSHYIYGGSANDDTNRIATTATGGTKTVNLAPSTYSSAFYQGYYTLTLSSTYTLPMESVNITYKLKLTDNFRSALTSQGCTPVSTSGATFDTVTVSAASLNSSKTVYMNCHHTGTVSKGCADYYGLLCTNLATSPSSGSAKFNADTYEKFFTAARNVTSGGHFIIEITATCNISGGEAVTFTATTTVTFSSTSLTILPTGVKTNQSSYAF